MRKLVLIFCLSCLFFNLTPSTMGARNKSLWQKGLPQVAKFLKKLEAKRAKTIGDKDSLNLWSAYLWGKTKKLSPKIIKNHEKLHLQHLFSPSGLHLSLVQNIMPKFLFPFIILSCFTLPMMMALKRMALIKLGQRFFKDFRFLIFLLCMLIELIVSSFHPTLSFAYSFLFLGIIYSRERWFLSSLLYWIFMGNLFCHMMLVKSFSIVGFLLGQLMLIIFSPLFFLQAINLFLPWSFFVTLLKHVSHFYLLVLDFLAQIATFFPLITPNLVLFSSCFLILNPKTRNFSYLLFLINCFSVT